MSQIILLSIKPEFIEQIFNGTKTIELRKCKPDAKSNDILFLYSTRPTKAIVGMCRIGEIFDSKPDHLWEKYSESLGVTEDQFWEYYKNSSRSIGIAMKDIFLLQESIYLDEIKDLYPGFSPPQTFRYFSKRTFLNFCKQYIKYKSL